MSGGWAESFAARVFRRDAVRNLGIGAGNSLMAYFRLLQEVRLQPGDTVVCATTISDAVCLTRGGYRDGALVRYMEEMIRHVGAAGARFVPVLLDTVLRDFDVRQSPFKASLLALLEHYGLSWVDVTAEFARETGRRRVPVAFYDATGHIEAGSEMQLFTADLVRDLFRAGGNFPRAAEPLHVDPARPPHLFTEFVSETPVEQFANSVITAPVWAPRLSLDPASRPPGPMVLEGLIVMTDPQAGTFSVRTPAAQVTVSAKAVVDYYNGPMFLAAYLPNLMGDCLPVAPGDTVEVAWDTTGQDVRSDVFFDAQPTPGRSGARVVAMLMRQAA